MKIIDFHAHIYPEKIAEKAVETIGKFYDAKMHNSNGKSENLIESGKKIGVTNYVVHSVATKPEQVVSINNFIISECQKHKEFIGFATFHPDFKNFEDEIGRVTNLGLKGVKMHPDFQKFKVDSNFMDDFYSLLEEKNIPLLLHAGDNRFDFSGPSRIFSVMTKHPKLKIIAAHFGGYTEWNSSIEYLVGKNVYFDTSSTLWKLPLEDANKIIKMHGAEKFLFGSDFPMWKHEDEWLKFCKLDFSNEELELVLYKNAENLLGL